MESSTGTFHNNIVRGVGKRSGGVLYDTAMIYVRGVRRENGQRGAFYDTVMVICKGV